MIVEQLKDDQVKLETEHQIYFVKENERNSKIFEISFFKYV